MAALDDLGVAGDDLDAGRLGGRGDRLDLGPQLLGVEALLEDQRQRQRERPRAGHREVVDGAVDRELADRAAGEADRLDDEAVGRHRQPSAVDLDRAGVAHLLERSARRRPGTSRPSISVWVALPPAPWAIVTALVAELRALAPARSR